MDSAILADATDNNPRGAYQVTETHATSGSRAPVFPPGRYGRRRSARPRRRWLLALLIAAALAASSLVMNRLYTLYGDPNYDAEVVSYTDITDSQLVLHFRVTVPAGGSAICLLRARSHDGAEVGRAEVRVDAARGQRHPRTSYRLATSGRAFIGEVVRCRAAG